MPAPKQQLPGCRAPQRTDMKPVGIPELPRPCSLICQIRKQTDGNQMTSSRKQSRNSSGLAAKRSEVGFTSGVSQPPEFLFLPSNRKQRNWFQAKVTLNTGGFCLASGGPIHQTWDIWNVLWVQSTCSSNGFMRRLWVTAVSQPRSKNQNRGEYLFDLDYQL